MHSEKVGNVFFTAKCINCKEKFIVNSINLKVGEFITNDKQSIFLTYYDCPHCRQRMFVQVDNYRTKEILDDVKRQLLQLSIAKKKGKKVSKEKLNRFSKSRHYLSEYRASLMKEYSNKIVYDKELGITFELRFNYEMFNESKE